MKTISPHTNRAFGSRFVKEEKPLTSEQQGLIEMVPDEGSIRWSIRTVKVKPQASASAQRERWAELIAKATPTRRTY